ncbi:MAG: murein L,D-transpeptidase [Flavisolibacter sp.]
MKQTLIVLVVCGFLASCTQIAGWSGGSKDSSSNKNDSLQSSLYKDESISAANAYSDLFLDSNAVESFIQKEKLPDSTAAMVRNFYRSRNYEFAWFTGKGITEPARGLWGLYSNEKDTVSEHLDKGLKEKMDSLIQDSTLSPSSNDPSFVHSELALTQELVQYAGSHPTASINHQTLYHLVPAKRVDAMQLADSILRQKDDVTAQNKTYSLLKKQLSKYYEIAKSGGWLAPPPEHVTYKKGVSGFTISAIKKRLHAENLFGTDTSNVFNDSLEAAIKNYQQLNGFQPTGIINDSLITVMNVPAQERVKQILVNMNRSLWMAPSVDSNHIEVNIPSFMLTAYEGGRKSFEMPVIVGKEGTGTVMFSGDIDQIVFDPVWNLPSSIVKNEIMPAMKKNPSYLKKHHMEVVNQNGDVPEVRQLPGKDNALGRVKFLFPNSFDIYLHDTPDKTAFTRNDRALSHGCIRVADPQKLAQYLLRDQQEWNMQKINAAMNAGKEQKVQVKTPEPVLITYFTAWVDEQGNMNFRNDVYSHDQESESKMFLSSQP